MDLLVISNQTVQGKILRLPLRLIPKRAVLPMCGGRLRGMRWVAGSSDHGCWLGAYELSQRRLFEKVVQPGSVVFDIGAHAGFYTLLASALVKPLGRVVAFEPFPANLSKLKRHLLLNRVTNVTVVEAAVSSAEGFAPFQEGPSSTQGRLSESGSLQVRMVSLDKLIARGDVPAPACLKIDTEGEEYEVLAGAEGLLARARPIIFLSTHGPERRRRCTDLLHSLGYRLEEVGPPAAAQLFAYYSGGK